MSLIYIKGRSWSFNQSKFLQMVRVYSITERIIICEFHPINTDNAL